MCKQNIEIDGQVYSQNNFEYISLNKLFLNFTLPSKKENLPTQYHMRAHIYSAEQEFVCIC